MTRNREWDSTKMIFFLNHQCVDCLDKTLSLKAGMRPSFTTVNFQLDFS